MMRREWGDNARTFSRAGRTVFLKRVRYCNMRLCLVVRPQPAPLDSLERSVAMKTLTNDIVAWVPGQRGGAGEVDDDGLLHLGPAHPLEEAV